MLLVNSLCFIHHHLTQTVGSVVVYLFIGWQLYNFFCCYRTSILKYFSIKYTQVADRSNKNVLITGKFSN